MRKPIDHVLLWHRVSFVLMRTCRSVTPSGGPRQGLRRPVIGNELGSGTDITAVQIGSRPCVILSQTATSVMVRAPAAAIALRTTVSVSSVSFGTITAVSAFTYGTCVVCCYL